ncbi:MFS transporter [Longispora fulva]|uniref:EmrB/QacA subfamily drug resistance transporter n=1 Tax=Longispora fulva TaxID=619741 RepID=A0A8J7GHV4_9ACTN|nr:MFS transporter [Longispora fulva]MBG6136613.1 EmrB/QacA subfamily drug resistance transporter [Longispora fulva]GIG59782.1 MFS transporter [Longispora fulva]
MIVLLEQSDTGGYGIGTVRFPAGRCQIDVTISQRWILGLTAVAALLVGLDASVVSTALTTIRLDLHASVEQLEWTVNAYTLSFAVLLLTAAALGDRFGRRRLFVSGLALFAVASAGCALAPTAGWLIAARAAQGAGAAAVMPLALTLLGAAIPPERRARVLGAFTAVVGASVPAGPLVGGAIVDGASWRWIFWLNLPVVAVLVAFVLRRIEPSRGPGSGLDIGGLLLAGGAAFGLVWGLVRGNAAGWASLEVLAALGAGAALTAGFVAFEARTGEPMLPLRLFRGRAFATGNAAIFFVWASTFGSVYFMAQFLQTSLGARPLEAGLRLMPWGAMTVIVPRIAGSLVQRYGARPLVAGGMTLHAASMLWIADLATPNVAYWQLVAPLVLSGIGVAAAIPATQAAVLASVAPADIGKASGAYSALRQLGGAFGVAALVAVFAARGDYGSPRAFVDGFAPALVASAALAAAAVLVGAGIPTHRQVPAPAPAGGPSVWARSRRRSASSAPHS